MLESTIQPYTTLHYITSYYTALHDTTAGWLHLKQKTEIIVILFILKYNEERDLDEKIALDAL